MIHMHGSFIFFFFFSSRRRHTRFKCDWSSDVCSSDLTAQEGGPGHDHAEPRISPHGLSRLKDRASHRLWERTPRIAKTSAGVKRSETTAHYPSSCPRCSIQASVEATRRGKWQGVAPSTSTT